MSSHPSIRELISAADLTALAARYAEQYCTPADAGRLQVVYEIIMHPHGPKLGGSSESPWTESTWLTWIHNRLLDLNSKSAFRVRKQFIKEPQPLNTVSAWTTFLAKYQTLSRRIGKLEGWEPIRFDESCWSPASEAEIRAAEARLSVHFPASLRSFYLVANGWPADGWLQPAIKPLAHLNFLADHNPHLYSLADEAEHTPGPFKDDPESRRLAEYRMEQGTRVKRSLAISVDDGDMATVLLDPEFHSGAEEWPSGSWAHWHPAMRWEDASFGEMMRSRFETLEGMKEGR